MHLATGIATVYHSSAPKLNDVFAPKVNETQLRDIARLLVESKAQIDIKDGNGKNEFLVPPLLAPNLCRAVPASRWCFNVL